MQVRVCGVVGGSGAGKTTLTRQLASLLGDRATVLPLDAYYRDLATFVGAPHEDINFDHPASLDHQLFLDHLGQLRAGRSIDRPVYDFDTDRRRSETVPVAPRPIVITEGVLLLALDGVRSLLDACVFLDIPEPIRLARRVDRDVRERGRREADVRAQFTATVAPMHDRFVDPHRPDATHVVGVDETYADAARRVAESLLPVSAVAG